MTTKPSKLEQAVLDFVISHPGFTARHIADKMERPTARRAKHPSRQVADALKRLQHKGWTYPELNVERNIYYKWFHNVP